MTGTIHEADVSEKLELATAPQSVARERVLLDAGRGTVACWTWALRTITLVYLRISIPVVSYNY